MYRTIVGFTLAAVVTLSGAAAAQSRGLGLLNGTVTSEAGEPVPGVTVKLPLADGSAVEVKTNDSGKWVLSGVGKGEFLMQVYKEGYAAKTVKVIVEKETMRPEPIKISIKKGA